MRSIFCSSVKIFEYAIAGPFSVARGAKVCSQGGQDPKIILALQIVYAPEIACSPQFICFRSAIFHLAFSIMIIKY